MEAPHELIELYTLNTHNLSYLYDRFSDLPEPIILHIFSFLDSNDIVQLSNVSGKLRKLCRSSSNLFFKLGFDSKKCTANCKQVQRFLKEFLYLHNAPEIHRFRLHWFCPSSRYDAKGSIFRMWVQKAIKNKVQELDIGVPVADDKAFFFPAGIESLRVLNLELQGGEPKLLALVFPSLESLSLTCLSIPPMKFGEWVLNSCKSLKVLNLKKVDGIDNFHISSSSLKVLTLDSCSAEDGQRNIIDCSSLENLSISNCMFESLHLNVNTPSLRSMQICDSEIYGYFDISISAEQLQTFTLTMKLSFCQPSGSISRIYSDNLPSLCNATLSLVPRLPNCRLGNSMFEDFIDNTLVELITSLRYAKILQLDFQIIEALVLRDQLPTLFKHWEHLEITVAKLNLDDDITAMAAFLVGLCSLRSLALRCDENATQLSETEVVDRLCSEAEKLGVDCGNMKTICTASST